MSLPRSAPPLPATPPARRAPAGACDTHIHMLAAPAEAPLWPDRVEDPAEGVEFDGYLRAYRAQMEVIGVTRTVIVQSILYGADNSLTARTIAALGPEAACGIGLVTDDATDGDLDALRRDGFRGVRLNYVHGGILTWEGVEAMAPRLADRGLHVQMLLRTDDHMEALADRIAAMPVPVVLDHLGWPDLSAGPDAPGFRRLLDLVERGHAWVKLSGLYRLCPAPFHAADAHVARLLEANPRRCLWGSDWPQIMLGDATRADAGALLDAFDRVCPDDETRQSVLVENPERLYGF